MNWEQKRVLINKTLSGEYNSNIAKLILNHPNHGMVERNATELTGKDGGAIKQEWKVTFIDEVDDA